MLQILTYLKRIYNIIDNNLNYIKIKFKNVQCWCIFLTEKFEQTFIMTLSQLRSTRRKPVNANQKVVAETTVLIVWSSANVLHNCVLVATSARIKRFKSTNVRQDYRDS